MTEPEEPEEPEKANDGTDLCPIHGEPYEWYGLCTFCGGSGEILVRGEGGTTRVLCLECSGTGEQMECPSCREEELLMLGMLVPRDE